MDRHTRILERMRQNTAEHEARTAYENKVIDDTEDEIVDTPPCPQCGAYREFGYCVYCDRP